MGDGEGGLWRVMVEGCRVMVEGCRVMVEGDGVGGGGREGG